MTRFGDFITDMLLYNQSEDFVVVFYLVRTHHVLKIRSLVLMGVGHTNADVVLKWSKSPIENCRLVCISKFPYSTYSGMLPGTLAGQFASEEMQISLPALIERAGAELILDDVVSVNPENRTIHFANRSPLIFDVLSVGIGSIPAESNKFDTINIVPIKPMQTFVERFDYRLNHCLNNLDRSPEIAIVGGGVAGIELAFCIRERFLRRVPSHSPRFRILTSGEEIGDGLSSDSIRKLRRLLSKKSIEVITGFRVAKTTHEAVINQNGRSQQADVVIWATGAAAPPVLSKLGLPVDDAGFLATDKTLRTTAQNHPIFAVGDSGTIIVDPSPKAGVYAVRQAPILWSNLKAILKNDSLEEFSPQKEFLKILNTGEGKALLQYKSMNFHAKWCWKLKTYIDKSFVQKYQFEKIQSQEKK